MRNTRFYSWLLGILVVVSLILSYFLFFNMRLLEQIFGINQNPDIEVSNTKTHLNQGSTVLSPTTVRAAHVVSPVKLFYRNEGSTQIIRDPGVISTISSLLESRPIIVESTEMIENAGTISYLQTINHIQIVLPESLPLGLFKHIFDIKDGEDTDIFVDRIYIPLIEEENNSAFIVDSLNNQLIYASLSTNLSFKDLQNAIEKESEDFSKVLMYQGQNKPIYLPIENLSIESQVFTLEQIPENIFVNQIFESGNYTVSEINNPNNLVFRYQNYLNTLDLNRTQQRFTLAYNRVEEGEPRTTSEKIRNALNTLKEYEYWAYDLRIDHMTNTLVDFRRYFNGYPIHTAFGVPDYGATLIQLRNDLSGDVYRYHQNLITLNNHINNVSQVTELDNHEEILLNLQDKGYRISQFDDIFIGYEWKPDMENYRKAELVPTWIFKFHENYYTYDDIQGEEFAKIWERESEGDN